MNILLTNASAPQYNLGLAKARNWWESKGATVVDATSVPELFIAQFDAAHLGITLANILSAETTEIESNVLTSGSK